MNVLGQNHSPWKGVSAAIARGRSLYCDLTRQTEIVSGYYIDDSQSMISDPTVQKYAKTEKTYGSLQPVRCLEAYV